MNLEHRNSATAVEFVVAEEPRRGIKSEGWQERVAMVRALEKVCVCVNVWLRFIEGLCV